MGYNPVVDTTKRLTENSRFVTIDWKRVDEVARGMASEQFDVPAWDAPVFPAENIKETIDFFVLGNALNFKYWPTENPEVIYTTEHKGVSWVDSFGMFVAIKRAIEEGKPMLDASYLTELSDEEAGHIFRGDPGMPMLRERARILREVGQVLQEKYDGHFYNLVEASDKQLFNQGKGMVERLRSDFPSFDDSVVYKGETIRFDKRAQLAFGMLYGRFRNEGCFQVEDIEDITVFADYMLPKIKRQWGVLVYSPPLARMVDERRIIPRGSRMELELRASTVQSSNGEDGLVERINHYRRRLELPKINSLHLDYKEWSESFRLKTPHHLTITTMY